MTATPALPDADPEDPGVVTPGPDRTTGPARTTGPGPDPANAPDSKSTSAPTPAPATRRSRVTGPSGLPLAVHASGDPARPTVLLVHGYPDTHRVWDDVAAALAEDHHVVRYDVRGAGGSGRPTHRAGYRLEHLADDLLAVADAVSPDRPVHVVAHDWGSVQSWEAVTRPGAEQRIASFTSMSGPCLDHVGHWFRHRLHNPTTRHFTQLVRQSAHSWYIVAFHLPVVAPLAWQYGFAPRWGRLLRLAEGIRPRAGHPQPTLAGDAVRGLALYRANVLPRLLRPGLRPTALPVQILTLTGDRYITPALTEGVERWAPQLSRRTLPTTHWAALLENGPAVAGMVREFVADHEPGAADQGPCGPDSPARGDRTG